MELSNEDKVRTLGEKEAFKYNLGILEADKQVEMKEKIRKKYLRRIRKLHDTNYVAETSAKNKYLGCTPR